MGYNINGLDDLSENLKKLAEKGVSELNKGLDKINQDINSKNEKPKVPEVCPYCGVCILWSEAFRQFGACSKMRLLWR